jgi:dTMP kinase
MKNFTLTIEYHDDSTIMPDLTDDENSLATFRDRVLLNEEEPLALYSKALGGEIGTIRVLRIEEPDSLMAYVAESRVTNPTAPGRFIGFEGIDGSGKTSLIAHLNQLFAPLGGHIVVTREPGGTPLGEEIRGFLVGQGKGSLSEEAELHLRRAAHAENVAKVIRPALEVGKWVLCEHSADAIHSNLSDGRGFPDEREDLQPDITLLLDLPADMALTRSGRYTSPNDFECKTSAFQERVRAAYLARAATHPRQFRVLDASRPLAKVKAAMIQTLEEWIRKKGDIE